MPRMPQRAWTAALVTGTTVIATALAAHGTADAAPAHKAVPHTKPAWTAHAKHYGHAKSNAVVNARVYLSPRGGMTALKQFATAVSTPGSASYHQFLTPAEYQARFGATDAAVKSVSSYLRSAGLRVTSVGANNRFVTVRGTVKAANKAFGTSIDRYQHGAQQVQAPASTLTDPASVAGNILTVTGLDTTVLQATPSTKNAPPPAGFRSARPCSQYYGQLKASYEADYKTKLPTFDNQTLSYAPCGYTGVQFRTAYEGNTTLNGSGVTIGIVDAYAAPTILQDANRYAAAHGDGTFAPGQFVQSTPKSYTAQKACGPSGWYGEETLDVESSHAMAPGAKIHYYGARSCNDSDLMDALAQTVSDDDAQLISNSWGGFEESETADQVAAYEQIFLQGATQGQSFLFSSGDSGDELANTGLKQADYPTSDPYVTSVGGTSTAIGPAGNLMWQTGWGTDKFSLSKNGTSWTPTGFVYGAGGGVSSLFPQPSYQAGVTKGGDRQVPDVAMDADPNTGMLIGETQTFPNGKYYDEYRLGGTSLASPLFAGMTALTLQHNAGKGAGLLNPVIYKNTGSFTDVKGKPKDPGVVRPDYVNGVDPSAGIVYSVRTFDQDSSLQVTKGYDQVTGVGVPNPGWLTTTP